LCNASAPVASVERVVGLGEIGGLAVGRLELAVVGDDATDVLDEHPDHDEVVLDLARELPPDQVLLVGARARKAVVVDLESGQQAFEDLAVAMLVADTVAGCVGVAEQQHAKRPRAALALERPRAAKTVAVRPQQVATGFVLDAGLDSGDELVADGVVILEELAGHARAVGDLPGAGKASTFAGLDRSRGSQARLGYSSRRPCA
jgi:hypothetical protein